MKEEVPPMSFDDFFSVRGLDYQGDEVKLARRLTWEGIEPSLPKEVGSLDIRSFCSDGVLHYINNFKEFLVPPEQRSLGVDPKVMVEQGQWEKICCGLVDRGLCEVLHESELFHVGARPVLSGLFGVSKQEYSNDVEILRLIMNLKPINSLCLPLTADTGTLPSITSMTGLYLQSNELLTLSSEDIRCFFYLFQAPREWMPCLGFARKVPRSLLKDDWENEDGYLCSKVLPMGFLNSVGIAQHIHRNIIKKSMGNFKGVIGGESEIRRDKPQSSRSDLFRVYLDNFDQLRKVDRRLASVIEGKVSEVVEEVRSGYEAAGLPRHPKKSTVQQFQGEIQGAWLDGESGICLAKPSKAVKYVRLALELLKNGRASQKELQVVGGGLVYLSMFKRPALSGLNHIWRMIVQLDSKPKGLRIPLRCEVVIELARFLTFTPLMFMNFRCPFDSSVTASDASTQGGGVCVSYGLTDYGRMASQGKVRFDGISALRTALDVLNAPVAGHVSVEMQPESRRVVESYFPDSLFIEDVELITEQTVIEWSLRFSGVAIVVVGSGPPCQGVSGLNSDRRGALRDHRSRLFYHVPRVVKLVKKHFPWAQVHSLTENVSSMDPQDCQHMNEEFADEPWAIDAGGISLARRPRLYWISWDLESETHATVERDVEHRLPVKGRVDLFGPPNPKDFLESGWELTPGYQLPTFTTSRPSPNPMRKPAGLKDCEPHELQRWKLDKHRYPPYQYRDVHCLHNKRGEARPPSILERELILGFPAGYTRRCMPKYKTNSEEYYDCRLSLLGNSWSVPVVAWLLKNLLSPLGVVEHMSLRQLLDRFVPGKHPSLQGMLLRPPVSQSSNTHHEDGLLAEKLFGLASLKGEDLLVHAETEAPLRYHRLRATDPAKLWRWRTVAGWRWNSHEEHINSLELRAVYTTIKWRVEQQKQLDIRCVHLVDSLVSLHSLSRGRSSSRKLMRTVMKISSFLLASGLQPRWGYVDTKSNPADRPSRWGGRRKWVRRKLK